MKIEIAFALVFVACSFVKGQTRDIDLAGTSWKFKGLLSAKGTLFTCPTTYLINFEKKHKLTGTATLAYNGKYWVKKGNRLKVRGFISKATPPGQANAGEFECRINYSKYLGMGGTLVMHDRELRIVSNEFVTMIFEPVE